MSFALRTMVGSLSVMLLLAPGVSGAIVAIEYDTGRLYDVNTGNAELTLRGETGVPHFGSLEYYDGMLYAIEHALNDQRQPSAWLHRFSPSSVTPETSVNEFGSDAVYYEGSMVFAPDGTTYVSNRGFSYEPQLFTMDVETGTVTGVVGTMSGGAHDINGMVWRASDNMLVAVDRVMNAIVEIDPMTAEVTELAPLSSYVVGDIGGMTFDAETNMYYLATGGDSARNANGSNMLFSVDIHSGALSPIGTFNIGGTPLSGSGISGLAMVPEPSALVLMAVAALGLIRRRRAA